MSKKIRLLNRQQTTVTLGASDITNDSTVRNDNISGEKNPYSNEIKASLVGRVILVRTCQIVRICVSRGM